MRTCSFLLLLFLLLVVITAAAQPRKAPAAKRAQLLKELKKCAAPQQSDCDEMSLYKAADLYKQGDINMLSVIMDVAPHSDGALSEALGEFFSGLLCQHTETFLHAVANRPAREHGHLLMLAASADGGGMGCQRMKALRKKLKTLAQNKKQRLANIARRCLAEVNKHNS